MKIMIVDDVPLMLRSLELMLSRNGFEVVTAASGEQALERLSTDALIGAVVTDLIMQPMSGVELFRIAQDVERFSDSGVVPPPAFVLMTSCEKVDGRESLCQTGLKFAREEFAGVIQKPVSERELIPILEDIKNLELSTS